MQSHEVWVFKRKAEVIENSVILKVLDCKCAQEGDKFTLCYGRKALYWQFHVIVKLEAW